MHKKIPRYSSSGSLGLEDWRPARDEPFKKISSAGFIAPKPDAGRPDGPDKDCEQPGEKFIEFIYARFQHERKENPLP